MLLAGEATLLEWATTTIRDLGIAGVLLVVVVLLITERLIPKGRLQDYRDREAKHTQDQERMEASVKELVAVVKAAIALMERRQGG